MYREPNDFYVKECIDELKNYAKTKGFKIVFRNVSTPYNDFTIFIYKPHCNGYHTKYLIKYDGDYNVPEFSSNHFDTCINLSKSFIENYEIRKL